MSHKKETPFAAKAVIVGAVYLFVVYSSPIVTLLGNLTVIKIASALGLI